MYPPFASHAGRSAPDDSSEYTATSPDESLQLQRPLPDGSLRIVARGVKEDAGGNASSGPEATT